MPLGLEVAFADDHIRFPAGHLCRVGGWSGRILAAAAIQDADPAATPPEIRTACGEALFVSAVQHVGLERFCQTNQIPTRKRPDVWGDLLEPFLDTSSHPSTRQPR